jgi:hypothetical protein
MPVAVTNRGGRLGRYSVSPSISGSPAGCFVVCHVGWLRREGIARLERQPDMAAKFMLLPLSVADG